MPPADKDKKNKKKNKKREREIKKRTKKPNLYIWKRNAHRCS